MLVRFIYESNALTAFLAIWKSLPPKPKIVPRTTSTKKAGGDPVRKVYVKPAGDDPVRSSSDVIPKAKVAQQEAAGDLLKDALSSSLSHLKRGADLKIGTQNQDDLDGQSYANMTASAFEKLRASGRPEAERDAGF